MDHVPDLLRWEECNCGERKRELELQPNSRIYPQIPLPWENQWYP